MADDSLKRLYFLSVDWSGLIAFSFLVYRLSKSFAIRCLTSAIMLASFPLFGFYSLLAWMMSAVYETIEAFTERSFKRLSIVAAGLALAIIIPQIYYSYWRGT